MGRTARLLAGLLALASLTSACAPPHPGTSLIVASKARIDSLDPVQASRSGQLQVLSALGDPLYAITADGAIEPRLASGPPVLSADGLRARIPLRKGVRVHDGATGSHEIELELKAHFSPLPRLLSAIFLTPVSPTAYRAHATKPLNDRFVGTGPYSLSFFNGQQQRLTPFPGYWGARPANGGIDLVTLSNSTALLGALRSGEVDVLLASGLEIDHQQALHRDAAAGRLREGSGPPLSIGFFSLLTDQPPLNNLTLRQALARSLDRATITERVSLGMRPPLRQLIPPSLPGSDPEAWPTYDPAAARALYRQAGYCNGKVFSLPLTFRSDIPSDRLLALTWQAQVRRDLGDCLELQVSGMESTTAYDQLGKGALTLFFYDWIGDYPDPENFLAPLLGCEKAEGDRCAKGNSALSGSFWSAPGLDAELLSSSRLDGPERERLLRAIQRRTAAAVPYLPVWLMAEQAWSGRQISAPQFDGSGRLRLDQLRRLPEARR